MSRETVLRHKAFSFAKNPKHNGYERGIAKMIYTYFNKNPAGANTSVGVINSKILLNEQLTEELHKPIIKKFEVWSSFKEIFSVQTRRYAVNKLIW